MKRFLGFVYKEFLHIFRDKRTLIILFGMPIIQILLFGYAITNEVRNANIAILDLSKDDISNKIINKISSSGYFVIYDNSENYDEIETVFKTGKVKEVIVFEAGFAEKLNRNKRADIQIITDATDPNTGTTLYFYTSNIIKNFQMEINLVQKPLLNIIPEIQARYNPLLKGVYLFVPGLITIILMLVCAMMTSISLTKEKELGSMEVLLASPMKPFLVIISKVIPYLILSLIISTVILLIGHYNFDVPIKGNLILLYLEITLFIVTSLTLGILISTKSQTQQVALMASLAGLMLPTILLSGFIFPIENMPLPLQIISYINPSTYFMIIVRDIMIKGSGLEYLWQETAILVTITLVLIIASIKNFRIRLQ